MVFAAVRPGSAAKLPSAGLRLNASKSESVPERGDPPGTPQADENRHRQHPGPPHPPRDTRGRRAFRNHVARRDETLADDLDVRMGGVSGRVALLLRSAEPQPTSASFSHRTGRAPAPPGGGGIFLLSRPSVRRRHPVTPAVPPRPYDPLSLGSLFTHPAAWPVRRSTGVAPYFSLWKAAVGTEVYRRRPLTFTFPPTLVSSVYRRRP